VAGQKLRAQQHHTSVFNNKPPVKINRVADFEGDGDDAADPQTLSAYSANKWGRVGKSFVREPKRYTFIKQLVREVVEWGPCIDNRVEL
jgi:hypothetical protein